MNIDEDSILIPDTKVRELFGGITIMTIWRWEHADIGFPPAVMIHKRKYRNRRAVLAWRDQKIAEAAVKCRNPLPERKRAKVDSRRYFSKADQ